MAFLLKALIVAHKDIKIAILCYHTNLCSNKTFIHIFLLISKPLMPIQDALLLQLQLNYMEGSTQCKREVTLGFSKTENKAYVIISDQWLKNGYTAETQHSRKNKYNLKQKGIHVIKDNKIVDQRPVLSMKVDTTIFHQNVQQRNHQKQNLALLQKVKYLENLLQNQNKTIKKANYNTEPNILESLSKSWDLSWSIASQEINYNLKKIENHTFMINKWNISSDDPLAYKVYGQKNDCLVKKRAESDWKRVILKTKLEKDNIYILNFEVFFTAFSNIKLGVVPTEKTHINPSNSMFLIDLFRQEVNKTWFQNEHEPLKNDLNKKIFKFIVNLQTFMLRCITLDSNGSPQSPQKAEQVCVFKIPPIFGQAGFYFVLFLCNAGDCLILLTDCQ